MPRFFINPESWDTDDLKLEGDEFHHCINVLRLQNGDPITIFNGQGIEMETTINFISKKIAYLNVQECKQLPSAKTKIALGQAIPKGKNMDLIIEKATELGVTQIYPIISERTIIRLNEKESIKKQEKWQRVAIEACKQSGQNWLPKVNQPQKISSIIESTFKEFDLVLIASLQEGAEHFKSILSKIGNTNLESVLIVIGPEGDLTPSETNKIIEAGAKPMTLGPITLRSETAAIYAISIIAHELF